MVVLSSTVCRPTIDSLSSVFPRRRPSKIEYFSDNDTVAVIEPNANFFRVYHADSMQLRRQYDIKVGVGVDHNCFTIKVPR